MNPETVNTIEIQVEGIVQGVGYRPFVYRLAHELGIHGFVFNNARGVRIHAQGAEARMNEFLLRLREQAPAEALVAALAVEAACTAHLFTDFTIRESSTEAQATARVPPDLPVCPDCLAEVCDRNNRRYFYPYINCTHCGPRFTITEGLPYDRPRTTMRDFVMCQECAAEYADPGDRRFHAQPNACPACGPHLALTDSNGIPLREPGDGEAYAALFRECARLLAAGRIIAIKGIGGYHLTCSAVDGEAVAHLRQRKMREARPFALMCRSAGEARKFVTVSAEEERLLLSPPRPIVLLDKHTGSSAIAKAVVPGNRCLGIMLPYTPLHHLLLQCVDFPLVMTSANRASEPIAYEDADALQRLREIADFFVTGQRKILIRCDDSVTRIFDKKAFPLRRSRGMVPAGIPLAPGNQNTILALGAQQKNVLCLTRGNTAFLSQHIGDLENLSAFTAFTETIAHLQEILSVQPQAIAYDLHPGYLATRFALSPPAAYAYLAGLPAYGIQHHHAHIAGCLAEHGIQTPVIGIALDGTGYGTDHTIWGGEIFSVKNLAFTRAYCLEPVAMPGGELAIKEPWRMATAYLSALFGEQWLAHIPATWRTLDTDRLRIAAYQLAEGQAPLTSSCGRLFDAVSALAGIRLTASYEGQAAVELEQRAVETEGRGYRFTLRPGSPGCGHILWQEMLYEILSDLAGHVEPGIIAARFHNGLAEILAGACRELRSRHGLEDVVLSGGCFMNMRLLGHLTARLREQGFTVYTHQVVPTNDGGISLGQAAIARQRTGEERCV